MMVFYHLIWDIHAFWPVPYFQFPLKVWLFGGGLIGGSFLFISGLAAGLTFRSGSREKILKGGLKIFAVALLVFAVSIFALPGSPIYFGILHCIGASLILASFLAGRPKATLIAFLLAMAIGWATEFIPGRSPWVAWLGMTYPGFDTADYFPLFPWGGVLWGGLFLSGAFGGWAARLPQNPPHTLVFLGRQSLLIYLLHQPILVGTVNFLKTLC